MVMGGRQAWPGMMSSDSKLMTQEPMQRVRIVLSRTSHPGNIGAAARALKTMGFGRLVLVAPRCLPDAQSEAMASGAGDILAGAAICDTLAEALEATVASVALTARRRELALEPVWVRDAADVLARSATGGEVAVVLGNETAGLSNEDLALCTHWAMIPANPAYSSLNLAAAVQVMCYELRLAFLAVPPAPDFVPPGEPAAHEEVSGLLDHLESAAIRSGFLDPERPGRLMLRLRRFITRAAPEKEEVNLLRGLLASFETPTGRQHRR